VGSASDELLGCGGSEVACGGACGSLFYEVRGLFAVAGDDHRVQMPRVVHAMAVGTEGQLAASSERVEHGAFGLRCELGVGIIQGADGLVDEGVAGGIVGVERMLCTAGLEREGSLSGSRG
jgi:hypothetical protein